MTPLRFSCLLLFAFVLLVSAPADAHEVGLSRGEYSVAGRVVSATLTFARRDVEPAGAAAIAAALRVRGDALPCSTRLLSSAPFEVDGTRVTLEATCPSSASGGPAKVEVEALFLADLPFGHRHLVHVSAPDAPSDVVLTVGRRTFTFASSASSPAVAPARSPRPGSLGLLWMGLEHILTGPDHLVFLFGLLLVGGRLRDSLWVVTAFTLGHSVSLALSTLGLFVPSPRLVEPAIALSIVWVGVENLSAPARGVERRWRIALPFGLVHGFGFASALHALALPRAHLAGALVSFNLGVELGQLAVLLPLVPLIARLRARPWFAVRGVQVLSGAIVAAGAYWLLQRLQG